MARIELPEGDDPEILRALSLVPEFSGVVMQYETAVWNSTIDRRLHELVRMRVAEINECTVCLAWRTPEAIAAGATEELLTTVSEYATAPGFTDAERVAIEYAEYFARDSARIPDELMEKLGQFLKPAEIVELTMVIGKYLVMGRFMQVLGLDQNCKIPFD